MSVGRRAFWETREVFGRFAEEQIGPYTREAGFNEEPEMRFYDVHNHLTAGLDA